MKTFKDFTVEAKTDPVFNSRKIKAEVHNLNISLKDALSSLSSMDSWLSDNSLTKDRAKAVVFQMNRDIRGIVDSYKGMIKELKKEDML